MIPGDLQELLGRIVEHDAEQYWVFQEMRYLKESAAQYAAAGPDYDKSIEYLNRGHAYLEQGRETEATGMFDNAILHCWRAISLMPGFIEAYQNLVAAYFSKGDYLKVIEVSEKIQSFETSVPAHNFEWARALFLLADQLIDPREAITRVDDAIKKAIRELSVTGTTTDTLALLILAYDKKQMLISQASELSANTVDSQALRETLDCEIICAKRHLQMSNNPETLQLLERLRQMRRRFGS